MSAASHLLPLLQGAGLVLAADSGLRHALALGLQPEAVVGDFDSVMDSDLDAFPDLPRLRHPVRKNELDLELAIELALARGADELVVLGAFGSRLDQSLAALLIGARLRRQGVAVSLHDGVSDAYPLAAGDRLSLDLPRGTIFSLLALEATRCSVSGAEYPLEDAELPFGVGLGLANVAVDGPLVEVSSGLLALIVERATEEPGARPPLGGA
jgi:thiamine pyrophosphokinase